MNLPGRRSLVFIMASLRIVPAAAADFACLEQCLALGRPRAYCLQICETAPAAGLESQAGVPENPGFKQIRPGMEPAPQLPERYDRRCLEDCRRKGYAPGLCRSQCRY